MTPEVLDPALERDGVERDVAGLVEHGDGVDVVDRRRVILERGEREQLDARRRLGGGDVARVDGEEVVQSSSA